MPGLDVRIWVNPESQRLGRLFDDGDRILFEYDEEFLASKLEVSPLKLPLKPGILEAGAVELDGLPGLFYESLPDGFGLKVMDRALMSRGHDLTRVSVLTRLAYLGSRGLGALTFHPGEPENRQMEIELDPLAREAQRVSELREGPEVRPEKLEVPEIVRMTAIAGGTKPKAAVLLSKEGRLLAGEGPVPEGYSHWLLKFSTKREARDGGPLEEAYAQMARAAGIVVPQTRLLELKDGTCCFGIARFDRALEVPTKNKKNKVAGTLERRLHVHTLCGLMHTDPTLPSLDYRTILQATWTLTKKHPDVVEVARRMLFNVMGVNRDDQARHFAFLMNDEGEWSLGPAFDLTYSEGMNGHHTTSVRGETSNPNWGAMHELCDEASIDEKTLRTVTEQVEDSVATFGKLAKVTGVSPTGIRRVERRMNEVREVLGTPRWKGKKAGKPAKKKTARSSARA